MSKVSTKLTLYFRELARSIVEDVKVDNSYRSVILKATHEASKINDQYTDTVRVILFSMEKTEDDFEMIAYRFLTSIINLNKSDRKDLIDIFRRAYPTPPFVPK